jgi:PAS domain S-box-containing protein
VPKKEFTTLSIPRVSDRKGTASAGGLRSRAEDQLQRQGESLNGLTSDQMQAIIHDLHVHEIELEMQNEQLRETQADLEAAREQFVELYDFAPIGYLTLDRSGIIKRANLTSVSMLGVERARLVSKPFNRFVIPSDQEAYYHCWRKVFASPGTHSCELRLQPSKGEIFYARLQAVTAMEGATEVCRVTLSDVTEQKRAEEALLESEGRRIKQESEEWKRLALDAGELGAWDQDLQTGRISCSAHACAAFGFPADAFLTWDAVVSRVHTDDLPAFLREVEKSTDPGGTRRCEAMFRVVLPAGHVRWLRFVARTFFDDQTPARPVRRTGVLADITRLKEAQEMLRSRAKHLDALVRERTGRLQEAVAELEHLSYTLVHDLRAPLRAIAGYTNLLLDQLTGLDPTHKRFLERSNAAALRMDSLIVDALSYSQVVRERFVLIPVDCAALLGQVIDSYPQFQEASRNISVEGAFPKVMGNPALLTQCFSNLISNALKFVAPAKTPFVRVFGEEKDKRVRIWFQDNGIGISEEGQKKIFGMFQRLNHDYEGTGIGLALVKKAVDRMGGALGVESKPGEGSRFWIELDKAVVER